MPGQLLNIPPAVIFVVASILVGLFLDRTVRIPKFAPLITGLVGLIGASDLASDMKVVLTAQAASSV